MSASEELEARIFMCRGEIVTGLIGPRDDLIAAEAQMREVCAIKHSVSPAIQWTCAGGAEFETQIIEGTAAFVNADKQRYLLRPVDSESGQRFERRGVQLRIEGADAELTGADGGPYESCKAP